MQVRALLFDVFGTLVDWRSGVAREAKAVLEPLGFSLDWMALADAWRGQYQPAMQEVRSGRIPYTKLDVLHRRTLQTILPRFGVGGLDEEHVDRLTFAWHKLDAWLDVSTGLQRLRQRFLIAPVSNGNIGMMCDLARRNDFRWDAILGADIARDFKPKAAVYLQAADALGFSPAQCMMCAAHASDLAAAADNGLRTALIARLGEGPDTETTSGLPVDVKCRTLLELAAHFGV